MSLNLEDVAWFTERIKRSTEMVLFILLIIFIFLLLFILTAGIIKDLRNPPPKLPRFNSAQEQADTVRRYLDAGKAARKYPRI